MAPKSKPAISSCAQPKKPNPVLKKKLAVLHLMRDGLSVSMMRLYSGIFKGNSDALPFSYYK